jgi:hypothetical protein
MRRRLLASAGALAAAIALAAVTLTAAPPEGAAKKTAWGHPDLQGVWASNSATPLQRPKELEGRAALTDAELAALQQNAAELFDGETDAAFGDSVFVAALKGAKDFTSNDGGTGNYNHFWLVERTFDRRTSLITDPADGRLPALTPEAERRQAEAAERRRSHPADGPEDRSLGERCIGSGVPMTGRGYNSNYQILQTPDHVVIHLEMMHDTRIIPLDGRPHLNDNVRGYLGDSRGRWEGNTLVVETRNFTGSRTGGRRGGASGSLHLVERFTRVSPDVLHYEYTVNDPDTYTRPYTAMIVMTPAPGSGKIYEFACHEGNHGMVGILAGHRAQEQAAGEGTVRQSSGR